jgi:hypothetical protein
LNGTPEPEGSEDDKNLDESEYYTTEKDDNCKAGLASHFWSDTIKNKLIRAVQEVVVPAGITMMPKNFGKEKNGKLKASKWQTLYSIHLPLCALDIFIGRDVEESLIRNQDAIQNITSLVCCTNIVGSKTIKNLDLATFANKYEVYTATSKHLFPNLRILPNHHYALHVPEQLQWWGSLMAVSEFPGERLIGILQKCKTSGNPSESVRSS